MVTVPLIDAVEGETLCCDVHPQLKAETNKTMNEQFRIIQEHLLRGLSSE
jgi:DNA-binding FrmR family transcriptional regulator